MIPALESQATCVLGDKFQRLQILASSVADNCGYSLREA
jgi:hypothetical protein